MPYNILIIPGARLYPINSGGSHAVLSFIQRQQHIHNLSIVLTPSSIDASDITAFQQQFPKVGLIPIGFHKKQRRIKASIRKLWRKLSGKNAFRMLWKTPFLSNVIIKDESIINGIVCLLQEQQFDLVQIEFSQNIALASVIPSHIKKIFVHHELAHTRVNQDMRSLQFNKSYATYISKLVEALEISSLQHYDGIITLSEGDKQTLQKKGIALPIEVANNFALFEKELVKLYDPSATPQLLFMGNEDHFPNKDGLVWFLEEVMPQIINAVPHVQLLVTGNWTASFKAKYQGANITFTGFVDDLDQILKKAISISPIRIGSGIRIKIITSMAKGTPVVSTTLGASGIQGLIHGENIMIADKAVEFAECCVNLLNDPAVRKLLSDQSYQLSYDNYTKSDHVEQRNQFYTQIIEDGI